MILRNDSLPPVPFDLIKDLYNPYGGKVAVRTNIQLWLQGITPKGAKQQVSARSTPEAKLEYAAVYAQKEDKDSVIESPDKISATELTWRILSKDNESWKLSWSIDLSNEGRKAIKTRVQVLFLAKNNFALDAHMGPPQILSPGTTCLYEASTELSPDLASRVHRAVAVVTRVKK